MSGKVKYTPQEKERAVIDYIDGNKSRAQICDELDISTRTIQDWAGIYKKHGITGFLAKNKNQYIYNKM
ncbi:MAG: transposase [Eubacteriales bacterium]